MAAGLALLVLAGVAATAVTAFLLGQIGDDGLARVGGSRAGVAEDAVPSTVREPTQGPAEPANAPDTGAGGPEGTGDGNLEPVAPPPADDVEAVRNGVAIPRRVVSGAITFAILPLEAANRAAVRIDGLPRGPASGSRMTLRPGEHRLEIVAEGFEPFVATLDSRPGAPSPTRIELSMRRSTETAGTP
jgi:hypothetical protein